MAPSISARRRICSMSCTECTYAKCIARSISKFPRCFRFRSLADFPSMRRQQNTEPCIQPQQLRERDVKDTREPKFAALPFNPTMRRAIWSFLLISIFLPDVAFAFPITKIVFHGNARVSSERLLAALKLEDESILNRDISNKSELLLAVEHAKQGIQNVYTNAGYLYALSLIHISEPTRQAEISYAVF